MADPVDTTDDDGYSIGNEVDVSPYQDVMQAPIIQDNAVDDSSTQGVCVLFDFKSCKTTWLANQIPTTQMVYPKDGKFVKELQTQRILIADVNREITHQKFRITEVIPSDQDIIVNGSHIIGEYLIHNPIKGTNLPKANSISRPDATAQWALGMIINNLVRPVPELNVDSDVPDVKNINLDVSDSPALNLIIDPDQEGDEPANSVLANFGGDFIFDGTTIYHRKHAGKDRKIYLRYGDNIRTMSQDRSINDTYVAIYPYAQYTPGQLQATKTNVDWNALAGKTIWTSVGSVTYSAGGTVDVYDVPVAGQTVIRKLLTGQKVTLGTELNNGDHVTDINGQDAQVTTVNGDGWYPISPQEGGGWIESAWVNFDKSGDYICNDVTGHVHIDVSGEDTAMTRYPISGWATVSYTEGNQKIHVYYSPDQGPAHQRIKRHGKYVEYKNGDRVHYDYYATDANGKAWYRIGRNEWLYGPHLSVDQDNDIQAYPSRGRGYVKKDAKKYKINHKKGTVSIEYHHLSLTEARKKKQRKYKTVYRGKGKKRHKVNIPNPDYLRGDAIHQKKGYYSLNYGQVVVAGTTYYKLSNGTYVKKSDIDWKKKGTHTPDDPDKIRARIADKKGKVEMYDSPSKGDAKNWSIPDGQQFDITHSAQGSDGKTWYEVSYKGYSGWIPADECSTSAPNDLEPTAPDDKNPYGDDDTENKNVDQQVVTVELDDSFDNVYNGALYADGMYQSENAHIMRLDLSDHIKHDDQDQSGLQPDGTWKATADDKQQLYKAAVSALTEYQIGVFPITMEVSYSDLDGEKADLLALSMYDIVHVDFTQFGDKWEDGRVSGTVWNMAGEDSSYDSVTIGEPPKTWQHTLLDQAKDQTDQAVTESSNHTAGLLATYERMLQSEGSSREAGEKSLMKQLGLVQDLTTKNGKKIENQLISMKQFQNQMDKIDSTATSIENWVLHSGSGVIQANPNWQAPTELTATNSSGTKMAFTGDGLIFYNADGTRKLRAGMDSNGQIYADSILAGTITTVSINSCTINSALWFADPTSSMNIYVGTDQPNQVDLSPDNGGKVIWLWSYNYESMVSSGQVSVKNLSNQNVTAMRPTYISVMTDGNHCLTDNNWRSHILSDIKDSVHAWVADYITVKGTRHQIWKG